MKYSLAFHAEGKKEKEIVIHLIFENKIGLQLLMLRSMITANDRYSENDRNSGIKGPDHFFHHSGRCLYFASALQSTIMIGDHT